MIENAAYQFHRLSREISAALLPFLLFPPFWRYRHDRLLIDWIKSVVDNSWSSEDLRNLLEYPKVVYHPCFGLVRISVRSVRRKWSRDVYICWISYFYTWNHPWLLLKREKLGTKVALDAFGVASARETTRRHFFSGTCMHNLFLKWLWALIIVWFPVYNPVNLGFCLQRISLEILQVLADLWKDWSFTTNLSTTMDVWTHYILTCPETF